MSHPAAQQFDRVASAYATSAVHAQGTDLAWLVEALAPQPTWQMVDLGTGAGHAALAVAPHVAAVTVVDVAEAMLTIAHRIADERGLANIVYQQAEVESLPFAAGSFDGAISRFSAHHWDDALRALREAARVLRPGAPLVLIDTVGPEEAALDTFINGLELLRDPSHVRDARPSEWQEGLRQAGFTVGEPRRWTIELETEDWLTRAAAQPWRADACRQLLRDAPARARDAFGIAPDGTRFKLHCALLAARRGDL